MPLDPSIILGAKAPEINSPLQTMQAVGQVRALQQEGQLRTAQIQEAQAQQQDRQLQTAARAKALAGQDALAAAIRKNSTVDPRTGAHSIDYQGVANEVGGAGFPTEASSWLKMQQDNADNLQKLTTAHRAYLQAQFETLGGLAGTAKTRDDFTGGVALAAAHGLIDEDTARQVLGQVDASDDPNAWKAVATHYQQLSPAYQKSQTPEAQATLQKTTAEATKAQAEADNLKKFGRATPSALQSENVMVNGKPTQVTFNPDTGKRTMAGPNGDPIDVSGKTSPIPAASIQIANQVAGQSLPAWATDASRPAGAEGNTFDSSLGITPNGLYQAALTAMQTGQYPPMGRGQDARAQNLRAAINSKIGAMAADAGMDEPAFRAFYKANASSLGQQQKFYDSAQAFLATADKNSELLDGVLSKIPDPRSPLLNQPLRSISQKALGNVSMSQFRTYIASVQNEYAKIITNPNLSGQLTDSARQDVQQLVDQNATVAQILGSLQALRAEGGNRLGSIGDQIQRIQSRMSSAKGSTPPAAADAPADLVWNPTTKTFTKPGGAK